MELSAEQLLLLGLVASVLSQLAKLLLAKFGYSTSRLVITIIVVVVSVALGYVWLKPELPTYTDPMQFALALLVAATAVFGFATLIYNVLLFKIFEVLKWTKNGNLTVKEVY